MNANIKRFLGDIEVGAKQSHANMTVYCLLSAEEADAGFITLDEAFDRRLLSVTEMTQSGSVPELKVVNTSDQNVLIMDGEELVGAKQNRVLNVTVLIAAKSETIVPVSCVEQGRWAYRGREFGSAKRSMSPSMKRSKTETVHANLERNGSFRSNQGRVWADIDTKYQRMSTPMSPTRAMSDLYEAHTETAEEYRKAFHAVDKQLGMAIFIDGEIVGIEFLGKYEPFRQAHDKLVQSYVMDALETAGDARKSKGRPSKTKVSRILESAAKGSAEKRLSVALGQDIRVESEDVVGAGLELEGEVLQLTLFLKNSGWSDSRRQTSMSRASARKRKVTG
jgi:hypothetical protein